MALHFQPLSMMELRTAPGEVLDRVARKSEAFIVERNGAQLACLVPLSVFMPDIQPARLHREFDQLQLNKEWHSASITDSQELELHFKEEGDSHDLTITVRLPHGYPNASPKVFGSPILGDCPHRWADGSLCIFGAMDIWNPGQHDVLHVLKLARGWLASYAEWKRSGAWGEGCNASKAI